MGKEENCNIGKWQCTQIPDEECVQVLLTQKRMLEARYVQLKPRKVKLWEIQEELEAPER